MANELDPRIVRVGVEVEGQLKWYEGLAITACGTKYANATQNECVITIANLDAATRDFLLTETTPFKKVSKAKGVPKPKKDKKGKVKPTLTGTQARVIVEVGRESTGASVLYEGDVCSATCSQPPDITVSLKLATGDAKKCNIISRTQPGACSLKTICGQVAKDLGLSLNFQAKDRQIANYSFTGGALKQVDVLGRTGNVNCYVDDRVLTIKDYNVPLKGKTRVLNLDTGLIGVPEFTEQGIKCKMLYDNQTVLGCGLQVSSVINPAADGLYVIYKLGFEVTSRDTPFYQMAEAKRLNSGD